MVPSRVDPVVEKGLEIFRLMEAEPPAVFNKKFWAGKLMEAAMEHPELKVALFRFIDVLPTLTTTRQLSQHIKEYFLSGESQFTGVAKTLLSGAATGFTAGIAASLIRQNIMGFSKNFIVGENPKDAVKTLRRIWKEGKTFTVDLLGEVAVSEVEADKYRDLYISVVDALAKEMSSWPARDPELEKHFPRLNISVKISSLYSRIGPMNHEDSIEQLKGRVRPIFRKIRETGGHVLIDMEMSSLKEITIGVFEELLDEDEFKGWEHAGIALQAYLKSARQDVRRVIDWARQRNRRINIRLVKGAYWEYEKTIAGQRHWPTPVFTVKSHTDWSFEKCLELVLANNEFISLAIASHNVRSIAKSLALVEQLNVPKSRYEFQALYGMAEPVKYALGKMGHTVREYAPVGELIPGMAYLVRRLLENTSNEGFLRKKFVGNASPDVLLAEPEAWMEVVAPGEIPGHEAFVNEPILDFAVEANRTAMRDAVAKVRREMGKVFPVIYGGKAHETPEKLVSVNPHDPGEVVCGTSALTREMGREALAAARNAQLEWGRRSPEERAAYLFKAAAIARKRRLELAAWEVIDVGKNWAEADADVCEAIDFLEYYGREMIRLGKPMNMGNVPGESNVYFYQPRGVGLVVAPWNFPLAISMGMVSAALVTGNAVLYKPSSQSLMIGWLTYEILADAGIPDGILNFIPGHGSVVGDYLVEHEFTDFIVFTGSLQVGLGIVEKAGRTKASQKGPKKVVIETGGKNAVIVDADADLDQAVPGVIQSAFGFQGQKCSACSRVLVLEECYDRFLARLSEAVKGIMIGNPEDPKNFMGPVVDNVAQKSILEYIEIGKKDGDILVQVPVPDTGCYVPPTVFIDLPPGSRVIGEEIFGPVLAVIKVKDLDEAIRMANASIYALTGGFFSRSPANIEKVSREFSTGNLYINRGITGAIVGRQPFGGFKMSGVGSKAGGPDYIQQFMEPRVVTENTMRRGFIPEDVL
ncbi:proline dehydrogenase family protein [Candidatus Deferrimicrobium sp.]|uniref:proline dehydrogenase family protein n=1 Tax=Candidatus Deferrimicrobium sp. TaxID=3060586 RepID=UPI003C6571CC